MRSIYVIQLLLLICQQRFVEPLFQQRVIIDKHMSAVLTVHDSEEPADAVYKFSIENKIDKQQRSTLLGEICNRIKCNRSKAVVWSTNVSDGEKFISEFTLFEDEEPVDSIQRFVVNHNLTRGYRHAILAEACAVVDCLRMMPVVWTKQVRIDERFVEIEILEGEIFADKIFSILQPYSVGYLGRKQVLELAKLDGIVIEREYAHVISETIVFHGNRTLVLDIYDDGSEPVDVIYKFCKENKCIDRFLEIADSIMPKVCGVLQCNRMEPVVYSYPIKNEKGTAYMWKIDLLLGEEAADAVHRFVVNKNMDLNLRQTMVKDICKAIPCKRTRPIVYRKDVNNADGVRIGTVEILEGDEVVDAAMRFISKTKYAIDEIALKNFLFADACRHKLVKCTRLVAHVFEDKVRDKEGREIGHLIIREDEEPVDKVHEFCISADCHNDDRMKILEMVCASEFAVCRRKKPIIFTQPVTDPSGNRIGNLEVQLLEEPADAVYRFFARHKLFQTGWNIHNVINQVCSLPQLACQRKEPLQYNSDSFQMGNVDIGPLEIWYGDEIVDILYQKRIEYNLTLHDQILSFNLICKQRDVYCHRTRAVVYELKDITKHDFEKFGNETCARKYMGWQFLSTVANSFFGSKLSNFIKINTVERIVSHPLFPILSLSTSLVLPHLLFSSFSNRKMKLHIGYKLVLYGAVYLCTCLTQSLLVEPRNSLDQLLHIHHGKLPDLQILEDQEPVDAILKWAKKAAKDHHPIVREPIYWDIIDKTCLEIQGIECKRRRAWEIIDMGAITLDGLTYQIEFSNPLINHKMRSRTQDQAAQNAAEMVCRRLVPQLADCTKNIVAHITQQLRVFESGRLENKNVYTKFGLEMDTPQEEIFPVVASMIRSRGTNISPFTRVDNGTVSYPKWDKNTIAAFHIMDSHRKVKDYESREWYDKPCTPYFGGALCAKTDKDGNMIIEV